MITIETFCRLCKETVDIPIADEGAEFLDIPSLTRLGVVCEKCRPTKPPTRERGPVRPVSNDP